eukprot:GHVU01179300.1.p1 GENE.GHVU01179300.1~~GHVU01179300.1.p1  ORF type:complete len:170 (+),score=16.72 GHVU01179300.1:123-632(+)
MIRRDMVCVIDPASNEEGEGRQMGRRLLAQSRGRETREGVKTHAFMPTDAHRIEESVGRDSDRRSVCVDGLERVFGVRVCAVGLEGLLPHQFQIQHTATNAAAPPSPLVAAPLLLASGATSREKRCTLHLLTSINHLTIQSTVEETIDRSSIETYVHTCASEIMDKQFD